MKSLGCPKQPYVLWEAQSLELQLSAVERLMGFVLGSTALLPPCQTEWGGWSQLEPLCDAWRARGWMELPISLPLGYMKVPRKSREHQKQGSRMPLKVCIGLMHAGTQPGDCTVPSISDCLLSTALAVPLPVQHPSCQGNTSVGNRKQAEPGRAPCSSSLSSSSKVEVGVH